MKVFLAAAEGLLTSTYKHFNKLKPPYLLVAFNALRKFNELRLKNFFNTISYSKILLLDSGAFTFMATRPDVSERELDSYIEEYAKFIVDNNIKYFFELDVDKIVGLKKVEEYRDFLMRVTKRIPIVVWHKTRGLEYWDYMIKEYPILAIGGIAIRDIDIKRYWKHLNKLVDKAHENGRWVHGLGVGTPKYFNLTKFDSVDTTIWLNPAKYGGLFYLEGKVLKIRNLKRRTTRKEMDKSIRNFINYIKLIDDKEVDFGDFKK